MIMLIEVLLWILAAFSTYVLVIWLLVYIRERKFLEKIPKAKRFPSVSIVLPAYNEEKNLEHSIRSVLNSDYPKKKLEIIVVNDGSTDNTRKIAEKFVRKGLLRLINQKNMGKGVALNSALTIAKGELFGVLDADTTIDKNTIRDLVGFLDSKKVGAVVSGIKPIKAVSLLEKFQKVEYIMLILVRKLMDRMNTYYVTPGALSLYKKKVLIDVGRFDEKNITEDLEMGVKLRSHGYSIKAVLNVFSHTVLPNTFKKLFRQRMRWNRGFLSNFNNYKHILFNPKYGYLGIYQLSIALISVILLIPLGFAITGIMTYKSIYDNYLHFSVTGLHLSKLFSFSSPSLQAFVLGLNIKYLYPFIVIMALNIVLINLSHKITKESYKNVILILLTSTFYYTLLGVFWLITLFAYIFKIKERW